MLKLENHVISSRLLSGYSIYKLVALYCQQKKNQFKRIALFTRHIHSDRASINSLYNNLQLQIPFTSSPPTSHIFSTSNRPIGGVFGVEPNICGGALYSENSQLVEAVGCFCRGAPSWMLGRILNATLHNNLFLLSHPLFTSMQRPHFLQLHQEHKD